MAKSPRSKPPKKTAAFTTPLDTGRKVAKDMFSWSEHPRRTLILGAAGAIIGLLLAGFGLLTAEGTRVRSVPPEAVAVVNGRPVLMSDYVAQLEAEIGAPLAAATPAQKRKVLDDMISEELFVQRGLEIDEPSVDPDVRAALVSAVQTQVAVDSVTRVPDDRELRAFYDAHQADYSTMGVITVKDFVAPPRADPAAAMSDARAVVAAIRAGAPADAAAARYGLADTGKVHGEELYFAAKIHLGDALFAKAAALKAGQVSDPIPQPDGAHVLAVVANTAPVPRSFEDSRQPVLTDFKRALEAKMQRNEDRFLRERADILVAKGFQ
jgi:parvulin-like peptidyl-prolyl isomerase